MAYTRKQILDNFAGTDQKVTDVVLEGFTSNKPHLDKYRTELESYMPANGDPVDVPIYSYSGTNYTNAYVGIELKGANNLAQDVLDKLCFAPRSLEDKNFLITRPTLGVRLGATDWFLDVATMESEGDTSLVRLYWSLEHPDMTEYLQSSWRW